jgi:MFS family permease
MWNRQRMTNVFGHELAGHAHAVGIVNLRLSSRSSFWVTSVLLFALFSSAAAPAPLYQVYQAKWGFSTTTLTAIFAVYVLTLLLTLLVFGSLSDHTGRRPVMLAALAMAAVAAGAFLAAQGVGGLIVARAAQGIAIGLTSGSLVAALLDLRPHANRTAVISSMAPTGGLAIGAVATSALVQYGPHPTRLIWFLLLTFFIVGLALVVVMPEPGAQRPGALASLAPRLHVPTAARAPFTAAAPCIVGVWALGGFYLSLGPSLTRELVGSNNLMWGGLSICLLTGIGALGSAATRNRRPRGAMIAGCISLICGGVITMVAIEARETWPFFIGIAIAGVGFGTAFSGAYRTVIAAADDDDRAGLVAAVFTLGYAALGLPALLAGIAASHYGLHDTSLAYAAVVVVLAAGALLSLIVHRQRAPKGRPVAPPPGPCTIPPCFPEEEDAGASAAKETITA